MTVFLLHAEERGTRVSKHLTAILRDAALRAAPQDEDYQLSRNDLSFLDLDGCFSFLSTLASICRMRSLVTENCWPTSSGCGRCSCPSARAVCGLRGLNEA